jgi:hypothetical protein
MAIVCMHVEAESSQLPAAAGHPGQAVQLCACAQQHASRSSTLGAGMVAPGHWCAALVRGSRARARTLLAPVATSFCCSATPEASPSAPRPPPPPTWYMKSVCITLGTLTRAASCWAMVDLPAGDISNKRASVRCTTLH